MGASIAKKMDWLGAYSLTSLAATASQHHLLHYDLFLTANERSKREGKGEEKERKGEREIGSEALAKTEKSQTPQPGIESGAPANAFHAPWRHFDTPGMLPHIWPKMYLRWESCDLKFHHARSQCVSWHAHVLMYSLWYCDQRAEKNLDKETTNPSELTSRTWLTKRQLSEML